MTDVAVVRDHFAVVAHVLAVVTTKATREIKMADVVRMRLPIGFHFREEIGLKDTLHFRDGAVNRLIASARKRPDSCCDRNHSGRSRSRSPPPASFVRLAQDFHRLPFQIRQRRIEPSGDKRLIDRDVRRQIDMGRPVMTIDAIHASLIAIGDLIGSQRPRAIEVFSDISLAIFFSYPRNYLAMIVGRDIGHLVRDIHVPVNPSTKPVAGTAAADINQHASLAYSVLLVIAIAIDRPSFGRRKISRANDIARRSPGPDEGCAPAW